TALNWAVRDPDGVAIDPASIYSWRFYFPPQGNINWNHPFPYTIDPGNPSAVAQPHIYSWADNDQPHHFLGFDQMCSGITIQGIRFTTDYTTRIGEDGSHIKLCGTHHRITQCTFEKAP